MLLARHEPPGGYVSVQLFVFGGIGLALIVLVIWLGRRRTAARFARIAAYAAPRGLALRSEWLALKKVAVAEGMIDGVRVEIRSFPGGRRHAPHMRVEAASAGPPGTVGVYRELPLFGLLGDALGFQDVQIGDPAFDAAFVIKAKPEAAAAHFLTPRVRGLIAGFPVRGSYFGYADGRAIATIPNFDGRDAALLDHVVAIVTSLGRA